VYRVWRWVYRVMRWLDFGRVHRWRIWVRRWVRCWVRCWVRRRLRRWLLVCILFIIVTSSSKLRFFFSFICSRILLLQRFTIEKSIQYHQISFIVFALSSIGDCVFDVIFVSGKTHDGATACCRSDECVNYPFPGQFHDYNFSIVELCQLKLI